MVKELIEKIEALQGLMIAFVTNERNENQPKLYEKLYLEVHFEIETLKYVDPNKFRTLESLWGFCKLRYKSYAERRAFVSELYNDILIDLHRKLLDKPDSKKWREADKLLNDNLEPVRRQWLKAKNFLLSDNPDFENCVKEATNSIESVLQILLENPNSSLGQNIKAAEIDIDIKKLISQMYGLVSNKDFVRHGGTKIEKLDFNDAEFFLEFAAISIKYLKNKII